MNKGQLLKPIVGIIASITILTLIMLTFNLTLGWPNSLITLVVALAVAWFFGSGIGGKISKSSWAAIAATAVVVGLAVGSTTWGMPWKIGTSPPPTDEGNFLYQATFTYIGSEENLPIENVHIAFPCPNVENTTANLKQILTLTLFWQDNDNNIYPEIFMRGDGMIYHVFGYYGNRKENLNILSSGITSSNRGPKLYYNIDRLYPSEGIWSNDNITSPIELANLITLTEVGEKNTAAYVNWSPDNTSIELSFWVELQKKISDTYLPIETFRRTYENGITAWYGLH